MSITEIPIVNKYKGYSKNKTPSLSEGGFSFKKFWEIFWKNGGYTLVVPKT